MARDSRSSRASRNTQPRRRKTASVFSRPRRSAYEFKPDSAGTSWLKRLYLTKLQRLNMLKWGLYALVCVLMLVIQDVIMSKFSFFGATTDLVPAAILLITVLVGSEYGSIFVLVASTFYWFSGSAPGPYVIAVITFLTIAATLFRQAYWHRSRGAILLCACCAMMLYEVGTFGGAIFMKLTRWDRIGRFLLSGLYGCALMVPLYPLMHKFGSIGGHTWKE